MTQNLGVGRAISHSGNASDELRMTILRSGRHKEIEGKMRQGCMHGADTVGAMSATKPCHVQRHSCLGRVLRKTWNPLLLPVTDV